MDGSLSSGVIVAGALNALCDSNIRNSVQDDVLQELISDFFTDSDPLDELDDGNNSSQDEYDDCNEQEEVCNITDYEEPVMDTIHADDMQPDDVADDGNIVNINEVDRIMGMVHGLVIDSEKDMELQKIRDHRCSCSAFLKKGLCLAKVNPELIYDLRLNMSAMTDYEKDLVILGKLSTTMNQSPTTTCSKRANQRERQRQRTNYFIEGHQICRGAFEYIHVISGDKLDACIKHYKENGLTPRFKKSGGRQAEKQYLSHEDIQHVVSYITSFTETHGIFLPGRIPGFKDFTMKLLPSSETKSSVFRAYKAAMGEIDKRAVKLTTFRRLWRTLLPFIVFCKPQTDLCWTCQQNNYQVYRSHNLPEAVKDAKLRKQLVHLQVVEAERQYYRQMVADAKKVVLEHQKKLGQNEAMSQDFHMHYSFDFAQQVHLPSDPLQPGPMYFLVPRKCGIFGVNCEAIPQQVNYLIDEAASSSKGSSAVISYLHHFLDSFGLGEKDLHLHCDNCSGQNKNQYMLWYLAWRVINGFHRSVTLNFLIAGHTKFAPDWCFGLLKQKFRKTCVNSLDELSDVVNNSTSTGVNIPQQVVTIDGKVLVTQYDWQQMLEKDFKALPAIKSYQHFRFTAERPGVVFCQELVDSQDKEFYLLKSKQSLPSFRMPNIIPPPGLPVKRQWYLFDQIRDFCSEDTQDIMCPKPVFPRQTGNAEPSKAA